MKQDNLEENRRKWNEVIAKAWMDPQFKSKLLANPDQVLKEHGISAKNGNFKIIQARKNEYCLILPEKPEGSFSETELRNIAAAGNSGSDPCCTTCK